MCHVTPWPMSLAPGSQSLDVTEGGKVAIKPWALDNETPRAQVITLAWKIDGRGELDVIPPMPDNLADLFSGQVSPSRTNASTHSLTQCLSLHRCSHLGSVCLSAALLSKGVLKKPHSSSYASLAQPFWGLAARSSQRRQGLSW